MIDIEIKPPKDLNDVHVCYCPYCDSEGVWHKYSIRNIKHIYYSKVYKVYYATHGDEDEYKSIIISYE